MIDFRTRHSSWYQVPVLYGWWDLTASGAISDETELAHPPAGAARARGQRPRWQWRRRACTRSDLAAQHLSSGAIVKPAPFSCSQ